MMAVITEMDTVVEYPVDKVEITDMVEVVMVHSHKVTVVVTHK